MHSKKWGKKQKEKASYVRVSQTKTGEHKM